MIESEDREFPAPPAHLSERSKQLWHQFAGEMAQGTGRIVSFQLALEYLDLADAARSERVKSDLVFTTKRTGVKRLNPLLKAEQQAMDSFVKLWTKLGLNRQRVPKHPFDGLPGVMGG
jgi:phage terminase small subunit